MDWWKTPIIPLCVESRARSKPVSVNISSQPCSFQRQHTPLTPLREPGLYSEGTASVVLPTPCLQEKTFQWRHGSDVKSTVCSSRGPGFNSQGPHGGSQPSVALVPEDLKPFLLASSGPGVHMIYNIICQRDTHTTEE